MIWFPVILYLSVIGLMLIVVFFIKYKYIFIRDKDKRELSKEFNDKFNEFTRGANTESSRKVYIEWLINVHRKNRLQYERKKKLNKLQK